MLAKCRRSWPNSGRSRPKFGPKRRKVLPNFAEDRSKPTKLTRTGSNAGQKLGGKFGGGAGRLAQIGHSSPNWGRSSGLESNVSATAGPSATAGQPRSSPGSLWVPIRGASSCSVKCGLLCSFRHARPVLDRHHNPWHQLPPKSEPGPFWERTSDGPSLHTLRRGRSWAIPPSTLSGCSAEPQPAAKPRHSPALACLPRGGRIWNGPQVSEGRRRPKTPEAWAHLHQSWPDSGRIRPIRG